MWKKQTPDWVSVFLAPQTGLEPVTHTVRNIRTCLRQNLVTRSARNMSSHILGALRDNVFLSSIHHLFEFCLKRQKTNNCSLSTPRKEVMLINYYITVSFVVYDSSVLWQASVGLFLVHYVVYNKKQSKTHT